MSARQALPAHAVKRRTVPSQGLPGRNGIKEIGSGIIFDGPSLVPLNHESVAPPIVSSRGLHSLTNNAPR